VRFAWLFVVAGLLAAGWGGAQDEPPPMARASLEPETPVTVGEPVRLTVEVLVPTWFTGAPRYPEIDLPDAMVIFEEQSGFNFSERIAGTSFAGQRREYRIFPMRPGRFELTNLAVEVRYAVNARPSPLTRVSLEPTSFEATVPEEAAGLDYFIASSLERTIHITARDTFAMMLPPLTFEPIEGLSLYSDPPEVTDTGGERGETRVGQRVESVTYVLQEEGVYELPGLELVWWNVEARRLRRAKLPGVSFSVAPNPAFVEEIPLPVEEVTEAAELPVPAETWRDTLRRWAAPGLGIVLLVAALLVRHHRRRLAARLAAVRRRRRDSEAAYFARFRRACATGDPLAAYRRLMAWLDRVNPSPEPARLERLVRRRPGAGAPGSRPHATALRTPGRFGRRRGVGRARAPAPGGAGAQGTPRRARGHGQESAATASESLSPRPRAARGYCNRRGRGITSVSLPDCRSMHRCS